MSAKSIRLAVIILALLFWLIVSYSRVRAFTGHSQTGWYLEGAKEEEPNLRNLRRLFCAILIGRGCANVDGVALEVQPRICPHQKGKLEIDFYI